MTTPYLNWRKSRRSEANGACVEVARSAHGTIAVRDSKNAGTGPILEFTPHGWATLLHTLRTTNPNR